MTEWLTTGQMIDTLKVGEVAESDSNGIKYKVKHDGYGIKFCHLITGEVLKGDYKSLTARYYFLKRKWHILPNYVSFEEALRAMFAGKKVWCELDGKKDWFSPVLDYEKREVSPSFSELLHGKWTIEGNNS